MRDQDNNIFRLVTSPITVVEVEKLLHGTTDGAHVLFSGVVRSESSGKKVIQLEFEAYEPMALREWNAIAERLRARWTVHRIVMHHRLGIVPAGEIAVVAAVSSPHRKEAFEACQYLMDELKRTVPIWKKEVFDDGSAWVSPTP
ncbi:MAG: molybdenum cofactor biosynthesis protein MoaE [Flavobacteriales bacterium]|nr:molybdenum cofactor biosynthesis protein MoaE [Flavobacteriales bacterium]